MEPEARAAGVVVEGVGQGPALTNETLRRWVKGWCVYKKKDLPHISTWDTHLVTNMRNLFKDQYDFNDDIGAWDTSSVTTMEGMFSVKYHLCGTSSLAFSGWSKPMTFDQDLGAWDTSKVTDMCGMFAGCKSFKGASIGRWDTAGMFKGASAFNQDLSKWQITVQWMSSLPRTLGFSFPFEEKHRPTVRRVCCTVS